ncbi:MAG: phenylalanine--tRNA ligase subunit beta [Firmicutes bacterium]|nr:phenylalanine--tRNA ligase subunit beta [Bacillota bacterium]
MLVPIKWLKEFVDLNLTPKELGDKLVSAGFEVERIKDLSLDITNVQIGRIISIAKHPNADKLVICKMDMGDRELQIITGATNVSEGDIVPVALDGAHLPCGKDIKAGAIRGEKSEGMLCGGEELGLTENDYAGAGCDGILILDKSAKIGENINEHLGLNDFVLDISITANRMEAHSVYAIAREVSAVTGAQLKPLNLNFTASKSHEVSSAVSVANAEPKLCPRYMGALVKNIKLSQSPAIIKNRLRAVGVRPINNIVDITNYVLFEVGQPLHAFDLSTIKGEKIVVRRAKKSEKITALDGKTYVLSKENLLIANEKEGMAIAGVMGGKNYSVTETTKDIVLESARFARDNVRATSKALNLRSDSSQRFERGVDFSSQEVGLKRALALIHEFGFGEIGGGILDDFQNKPNEKIIKFSGADIEYILGVKIEDADIIKILNFLQIPVKQSGKAFTVIVPPFREDIFGVNDIAEELIRIYGYEKITPTLLKSAGTLKGGKNSEQKTNDKIKNFLVGKGAYEILTYSFVSPKIYDMLLLPEDSPLRNAIVISNPLGEDYSVMRTTLSAGMIKALAKNSPKTCRLFEVAKVFLPVFDKKGYPTETNTLVIGSLGEESFYSFKEIIEDLCEVLRIEGISYEKHMISYMHEGRCAKIMLGGETCLGYFGEVSLASAEKFGLDKRVYVAEINYEILLARAKDFGGFKVQSKYPAIERDLALICDNELPASEILSASKRGGGGLVQSVEIFDVYTGDQVPAGKKSVAIRFVFQSDKKTLTDNEAVYFTNNILKELNKIGATLR